MNKIVINVPREIEYLSDWKEFDLPNFPHILNKQITGCGFTQWALTCNKNIILCSPRRILLENKFDDYKENYLDKDIELSYRLYYAKNEFEKIIEVDKNVNKDDKEILKEENIKKEEERIKKSKEYSITYKNNVKDFLYYCQGIGSFCKIMVTYDSFRKVKEALEEIGVFNQFYVVVDEMQSIFTDSRFKSNTEMEFVSKLQESDKICYVSATPMIEEYLDMIDEFKNLPYYELDWRAENPGRLIKPRIFATPCSTINKKALEIIEDYRIGGKYKSSTLDDSGKIKEVYSNEVIFYINSVKNICDILRLSKLTQEECNILCAETEANKELIRKAFGVTKKNFLGLGSVPLRNEINKKFTFCTRTVYLGADFYSTNARSYVFSDANIESLSVDITLDLPQILGRQRLPENPWKNELNIFFKPLNKNNKVSVEEFKAYMNEKIKDTNNLLEIWNDLGEEKADSKLTLVKNYEIISKTRYYRDHYVSVNRHEGSRPVPAFNNLVMISELRSFEIQQKDYADMCSVRNTINSQFDQENETIINSIISEFESISDFVSKMKYLCLSLDQINEESKNIILTQIEDIYRNYYITLGPDRISSVSYQKSKVEKLYKNFVLNQEIDISSKVIDLFKLGQKYSKAYIKEELKCLYTSLNYKKTPKATDLEEYFNMEPIKLKDDKGWVHGFRLISLK
jgi:hypothetical protein